MGWRALLQRLFRRRPQPDGGEAKSPAEELRDAVQDLKARQDTIRLRHPGKQHHIDDYRELQLDGTRPEQFSSALMDLTRNSYANRQLLDSDGKPRTELPADEAGQDDDPERLKQRVKKEADEIREDMKKRGARERKHYYSASERGEVGEIDRTYRIAKDRKDRPPGKR